MDSAQMLEAFPFDSVPKYLLRDRDAVYGHEFRRQLDVMDIKQVLSAPRSPWQRAYVERVIGSIRRECLDHLIVFNEVSLRGTLRSYPSLVSQGFARAATDSAGETGACRGGTTGPVNFTTATNDGPPDQRPSSLLIG